MARPGTSIDNSAQSVRASSVPTPPASVQLAPGTVTSAAIADGAITLDDLAPSIRGNVQYAVPATVATSKGQVLIADGPASVIVVAAPSANGQVLTSDTAQPGGALWSTPAAGAGAATRG